MVKRALENRVLALEHQALKEEVSILEKKRKYAQIIGKSAPMQRVYELITQVASSRASVLITGESGVGKELVADAIHNLSERRAGPFIKVHCAALTEDPARKRALRPRERQLYRSRRPEERPVRAGRYNGTIFLDEIGEINPAVQVSNT